MFRISQSLKTKQKGKDRKWLSVFFLVFFIKITTSTNSTWLGGVEKKKKRVRKMNNIIQTKTKRREEQKSWSSCFFNLKEFNLLKKQKLEEKAS